MNNLEYLKTRVIELDNLSDNELKVMGDLGRQAIEEREDVELGNIRRKHGV